MQCEPPGGDLMQFTDPITQPRNASIDKDSLRLGESDATEFELRSSHQIVDRRTPPFNPVLVVWPVDTG